MGRDAEHLFDAKGVGDHHKSICSSRNAHPEQRWVHLGAPGAPRQKMCAGWGGQPPPERSPMLGSSPLVAPAKPRRLGPNATAAEQLKRAGVMQDRHKIQKQLAEQKRDRSGRQYATGASKRKAAKAKRERLAEAAAEEARAVEAAVAAEATAAEAAAEAAANAARLARQLWDDEWQCYYDPLEAEAENEADAREALDLSRMEAEQIEAELEVREMPYAPYELERQQTIVSNNRFLLGMALAALSDAEACSASSAYKLSYLRDEVGKARGNLDNSELLLIDIEHSLYGVVASGF